MVQNENVQYVEINITTNCFEFVGTSIELIGVHKDSSGFYKRINWSEVKGVKDYMEIYRRLRKWKYPRT